MALPVTIPNTFANATTSIPLSQLDANFGTLANAVNGLNSGSETLANLKATTANVGVLTVTGNATIGDASTDTVTLNSTLTANTAVIFAAGTSAAPSITTTGDLNTGIFFPAADTIAFAEGGTEVMRIDSDGDVGIGTTSPSRRLTTQFDSATTYSSSDFDATSNQVLLRNANTTTNAFTGIGFEVGGNSQTAIAAVRQGDGEVAMVFGTRVAGVRGERMRIDSSGNLLIAATAAVGSRNELRLGGNAAGSAIMMGRSGTNKFQIQVDSGDIVYLQNTANTAMIFDTNNTERARITSGGYFKASNNGAYVNAAGAFHEMYSTGQNTEVLIVRSENASYTGDALFVDVNRNTTNNSFYPINYYNRATTSYRFRVADSGAIATAGSITLGSVTPATSGIGVQFPATQSASSDANTLDDYEEGTWTPVIAGTSTAGTATYNTRDANYTKVGRVVHCTAYINYTSGTGTGNIKITGFPFTAKNDATYVPAALYLDVLAYSSGGTPAIRMEPNTTEAYMFQYFYNSGSSGIAYDSTASIFFQLTYFV